VIGSVRPPRLCKGTVLRLCREGGVAHFPGLARPRRIDCSRCSEAQLAELQRLLEMVADACPLDVETAGADRRSLLLSLEDAGGREVWQRLAAEETVPQALLVWWRRAEPEEG
jgi:hypothetical protein